MRRISARISSRSLASRFDSGSSISTQRRLDHDRARDRDALLLAAGQLARQLVLVAGELHELERLVDARASISAFGVPRIVRPKPTLLRTVMCGNSA